MYIEMQSKMEKKWKGLIGLKTRIETHRGINEKWSQFFEKGIRFGV